MNFQSIVLFLFIAAAVAYGIYDILKSKGACDDCEVASCPAHIKK
ncbi:hypothetical protein [Lactovum odontotermitis]